MQGDSWPWGDDMRAFWLLLLTLGLAGCGWQPQPIWPIFTPTPTAAQAAKPQAAKVDVAPSIPTPFSPVETPELAGTPVRPRGVRPRTRVCTGYENGALNVRACPGTECAVRFILAEGMEVVPTGERVRVGESTWIRLAGPVQGWVNGRYLCREGAK